MSKETLAEKEIREQYEDMTTPPQSDWKQEMCDILANSWAKNKKGQIVIYAYEMRDFIRQLLQQTRNEVGQKMFKIAYEKGVKTGRAEMEKSCFEYLIPKDRAETLKEVWKYLIDWNLLDRNMDWGYHLIWLKKKLGIKLDNK